MTIGNDSAKDSIEKFLYYNSPAGMPLDGFYVGVGFEIGGAYEDWGWAVYKGNDVYCCHKHLSMCLKMARDKYAAELSKEVKE